MVLADLGRRLNAALSSLNRATVVDEKVGESVSVHSFIYWYIAHKVLDATLKEITAALLESDVNVKLVASLRQKVKTKVKAALDTNAAEKKEINRKHLIQKVGRFVNTNRCSHYLMHWRPFSTSLSPWWILESSHINPRKVNPMSSWLLVSR